MNRRDMLRLLGAAAMTFQRSAIVGGTAACGDSQSAPGAKDRLSRIGLQLYTVRDVLASDFEGTLARVAAIGYREVEFAGYFDRTPQAVRAALVATGLDSPSAHIPIEAVRLTWSRTLDDAAEAGHQCLLVAWIPEEDRRTLDGYQAVADLFNSAGAAAARHGMRLGYHNHSYEFAPLGGRVPYDILLESTDPALVQFEMDLYWITLAGGDPLAYFARYPGRFAMVHVKDMDGTAKRGMADVGKGVIDFPRILAQRHQAGIEHFYVEHDNPSSPFDSIRASYTYLKQLEF